MIREGDVQWWVLEARKHPESAPAIIEELAKRLAELDAENERLRDEAIRSTQRPAPAPDADELRALRERVADLQSLVDGTSGERSLVLVSDRMQAARLSLIQARRATAGTNPALNSQALLRLRCLVLARSRDNILLVTSQGHGSVLRASDVPSLGEDGIWPAVEGDPLPSNEWLSAGVAIDRPPRFWTIITRRGFVRQYIRVAFDRAVANGDAVVASPVPRDEARSIVVGDRGDLLVVSRWGRVQRFPQRSIPSQGSMAMKLDPDDQIAGALPLPSETEMLIVTAAGYALRRNSSEFKAMTQPGGAGRPLIRAYDTLAVFHYEPDAPLLFLTYSGRLVLAPVADVALEKQASKGTLLRDLNRDPAIAVVTVPAAAWLAT